jgi:hypothetical protein
LLGAGLFLGAGLSSSLSFGVLLFLGSLGSLLLAVTAEGVAAWEQQNIQGELQCVACCVPLNHGCSKDVMIDGAAARATLLYVPHVVMVLIHRTLM